MEAHTQKNQQSQEQGEINAIKASPLLQGVCHLSVVNDSARQRQSAHIRLDSASLSARACYDISAFPQRGAASETV